MRRLIDARRGNEDGAIVVLMAAFTLVIVAMAALVVDVGALVDERRQLQNGADAAALAVAGTCAAGPCDPNIAQGLAEANARDNDSAVDSVTYPAPNQVRVATSTRANGSHILPYSFAQVLSGQEGETVHASAVASWSGLSRGRVIPLTLSKCELDRATSSNTVFDVPTVVLFHAAASACTSAAGRDLPGGFGWLRDNHDDDPRDCSVALTIADTVQDDTGTPGTPHGCDLSNLVGTDVLLPLYDSRTGTGNNGRYQIYGFGKFHLTGYRFPGQSGGTVPCSPPNTCVGGSFIQFVATGDFGGPNVGNRVTLVS